MANPTTLTVTALAAGGTAEPSPDTIDTANTTTGIPIAVPANCNQLLVRIKQTNSASGTQTLAVKAGPNPPAFRGGMGNLTFTSVAKNAIKYLRLETARYMQADGTIRLLISAPSSDTLGWEVMVFNMAKI